MISPYYSVQIRPTLTKQPSMLGSWHLNTYNKIEFDVRYFQGYVSRRLLDVNPKACTWSLASNSLMVNDSIIITSTWSDGSSDKSVWRHPRLDESVVDVVHDVQVAVEGVRPTQYQKFGPVRVEQSFQGPSHFVAPRPDVRGGDDFRNQVEQELALVRKLSVRNFFVVATLDAEVKVERRRRVRHRQRRRRRRRWCRRRRRRLGSEKRRLAVQSFRQNRRRQAGLLELGGRQFSERRERPRSLPVLRRQRRRRRRLVRRQVLLLRRRRRVAPEQPVFELDAVDFSVKK